MEVICDQINVEPSATTKSRFYFLVLVQVASRIKADKAQMWLKLVRA